jgi:hypothetical protein
MVGGAILAGVALSGARMFKGQRNSQAKLDHEQILQQFHQGLTKFLQDENNCNATFSNWNGYTPTQVASATGATMISDLYTCSNCGLVQGFNYDLSNSNHPVTSFFHVPNWIENVNNTTVKQRGLWRLTSLDWKSNPGGTGIWTLQVTYEMDPSFAGSRAVKKMSVRKDIALNFRFTENASIGSRLFKECLSPKESSVNNLQNDICTSMSTITSSGMIMSWSDAEQKCVVQNGTPVKTCPAGMVVEGIRSDGSVHCEMLNKGVDPTMYVNPTSCPPSSTIQLQYDPVTKKMKAVCT